MSWQDLTRGIASEFTAASALGRAYTRLCRLCGWTHYGEDARSGLASCPGCERVRDTSTATARRPARQP